MHVPPGPQVAQETSTFRLRHLLPQALGVRAQTVDDDAPILAFLRGRLAGGAVFAQQVEERLAL
jgi:hypothetical protein